MTDFDLRDGRLGAVVGTTRLIKKCELEGASSGLASGNLIQWTASPTPFRILAVWVTLSPCGTIWCPDLGFNVVIWTQGGKTHGFQRENYPTNL